MFQVKKFFFIFSVREQSKTANFFNIFSHNLLRVMSEKLPTSEEGLLTVEGMTMNKLKQYRAERFLNITNNYAAMINGKLYTLFRILCSALY